MVAENSECRGVNWCSEGEEKKCEGRERKLLLLYFIKVKVNNLVWQAFIGCLMMTHRLRWPHLLAAKWLIVWVPYALKYYIILRAIAPVSDSQVSLGSPGPFSKHRQTIYQNAQNYILIIILILVYPNFHLHKN